LFQCAFFITNLSATEFFLSPKVKGAASGHFSVICQAQKNLKQAPEIKQVHPLNLSISVSGGKETNKDCLSMGD